MTIPSPISLQYDAADTFDVRDIIARVEHLEQLRQPGPVDLGPDDNDCAQDDLFAELADLEKILADLRGNGGDEQWRGDWYPVTLIRDSYFKDYARELAEDCGPHHGPERQLLDSWPYRCIDWEQAARELRMDYSSVNFGGITYWFR